MTVKSFRLILFTIFMFAFGSWLTVALDQTPSVQADIALPQQTNTLTTLFVPEPLTATVSPTRNTAIGPLAGPVSIQFSESIVSGRLSVHAMQHGRQTANAASDTFTLTPSPAFLAGERVQVTAQTDGQDFTWQFRAIAPAGQGVFLNTPDQTIDSYDSNNVELGDFNGDGFLDAFVVLTGSNRVLLNDGTGVFNQSQELGSAGSLDVALGDVDGDGDLDAVVANVGANQVWRNNRGTFSAVSTFGSSTSHAVALGDLDNDGDLDAFIGNHNRESDQIWLNNGSGEFGNNISLGDTGSALDVALGDFNNDGYLDAYVAHAVIEDPDSDSFDQIWINEADGTATMTVSGHTLFTSNRGDSESVALGDVNGDSYLDAVVGHHTSNNVRYPNLVWLNNGPIDNYRLGRPHSSLNYAAHESFGDIDTRDLALADFDADGDLDVIVVGIDGLLSSHSGLHSNNVWLNNYTKPTTYTYPLSNREQLFTADLGSNGLPDERLPNETASFGVAVGDVDNDNDIDIYIANAAYTLTLAGGDQVRLNLSDLTVETVSPSGNDRFLADGNTFSAQFNSLLNQSTITTQTFSIWGEYSGYYNGTTSFPANNEVAFLGSFKPGERVVANLNNQIASDNDFKLSNPFVWQVRQAVLSGSSVLSQGATLANSQSAQDVALADLDGDSDLDALVAYSDGNSELWRNNNGVFTMTSLADGGNSTGLAIADFDFDGQMDGLVVKNSEVELINNVITPTISTAYSGSGSYTDLALGDVDHDGWIDAVLVGSSTSPVVLTHTGTGNFNASTLAGTTSNHQAVAIGDLNNDGSLDLVMVGTGSNALWLYNTETNAFGTETVFGSGNSTDIALGDLNGDGYLDLFITHSDGADQYWLNNGGGGFSTGQSLGRSANSQGVTLKDVDADGDLDAVVAVSGANVLWLNRLQTVSPEFSAADPSFIGTNNRNSVAIAVGDLDGDGDMDGLAVNSGTDHGVWYNVNYPKFQISKSSNVSAIGVGEQFTYTIAVTNVGTLGATNVVITDRLPSGVQLNGKNTGDIISWTVGTLGINATQEVSLVVTASDTVTQVLNNQYGVSSNEINEPGADAVATTILYPLSALTVTGPTEGFIGNSYTFTATVSPTHVGQPLTFQWQSNQGTQSQTSNALLTNTFTVFSNQTGTQVMTVTAFNSQNRLTQTHTITLNTFAVQGVSISGDSSIIAQQRFSYTASVSPTTATPPITFTWQVEEQGTVVLTNVSRLSQTLSYVWATPGTKTLTVTAQNSEGVATSGLDVLVTAFDPKDIALSGPLTGLVGTSYVFTASVAPSATTPPITFTWQTSDGLTNTEIVTRGVTSTAAFTLTNPGLTAITVTAVNVAGQITSQNRLTASLTNVCMPPTLTLRRIPNGELSPNTKVRWLAESNSTAPHSYNWLVNGVTAGGNSAIYETTFDTASSYQVQVTATNRCGVDSASQTVQVAAMAPDLSQSFKQASPSNVQMGDRISYTIVLHNISDNAETVDLRDAIPNNTTYVANSAQASSGQVVENSGIIWTGDVVSGTPVMIEFAVDVTAQTQVDNAALVTSGDESLTLTAQTATGEGVGISVNGGVRYTNQSTVTVSYNWPELNGATLTLVELSNDPGFNTSQLMALPTGTNDSQNWQLNVSGYTVVPQLVYARFYDNFGQVYGPVRDWVIYDNTAPQVTAVGIEQATSRQNLSVALSISSSDDNSGVTQLELANDDTFMAPTVVSASGGTTRVPWSLDPNGTVYVRAIDRAGNVSSVLNPLGLPPLTVTVTSTDVGGGLSYSFTGAVSPAEVTMPLTYTWQANGQAAQVNSVSNTTDSATFTWQRANVGTQVVTLTVANLAGSRQVTTTVTIEPSSNVYLPVLVRP